MNIKEVNNESIPLAFRETFKSNPVRSALKIAAIVATIALSILLIVSTWPISTLPVFLGVISFSLLNPSLTSCFFFLDIKNALFAQFKKNHAAEKVANSEVVLVLEANHDHNRIFQEDQRALFKKIKQRYALAYEKISNLKDIQDQIDKVQKQNNKIKAIWIRAHGSPTSLCLDKNSYLNLSNISQLSPSLNKMEPEGSIILDSCSTGREKNFLNIAQAIAFFAQGRTVIASSRDTTKFSLKLGKENLFDIKFWTAFPSKKAKLKFCSKRINLLKYPSRFINAAKELIFHATEGRGIFKNFAYDATKIYRLDPSCFLLN